MAKSEFISAFFDAFDKKVLFTQKLFDLGKKDEALMLCCAYIDAMGTYLGWPSEHNKRNFVNVLMKHSRFDSLSLVHPRQLVESVRGKAGMIANAIEPLLSEDPPQLFTKDEVLAQTQGVLSERDQKSLKKLVWMGTLAAIAYSRLRIPHIHRGAGATTVEFSDTTYNGKPAPKLDFKLLHSALINVVQVARKISEETNTWFGHNFAEGEDDT